MAAVSTNPYPAPTSTPPNLPTYKGRLTLESRIDQLIETALLPKEATRDYLLFMASKMWELRVFILKCGPGKPTWRDKKTLKHPDFPEVLRLKTLFNKLIKATSAAIALRGGVEAFHIIWGRDVRQHIYKNIDLKAKGGDTVMTQVTYGDLLLEVGKVHHKVLFPNMPPYEKVVGKEPSSTLSLLKEAVEAGKFLVEDGLNAQIISDQEGYQAGKKYASEMSGQIAIAQAGVANAYRQALSGISTPLPANCSTGIRTTANMAWSPSNGASYTASTTPGMTYGYQTS